MTESLQPDFTIYEQRVGCARKTERPLFSYLIDNSEEGPISVQKVGFIGELLES